MLEFWGMKTALVIGGNRFVGRRLVRLLCEHRVEVTQLNRTGTGEGAQLLRADRSDPQALESALGDRSWDVVYDFACFRPSEALAATRLLKGRTENLVVISSQSVYGWGADLQESAYDPLVPGIPFTPERADLDYAENKRQMERGFLLDPAAPTHLVRFPILLGTDDYTRRLHFHIERALQGQEIHFPNVDARLCFAHAPEAADFLLRLGEVRDSGGPINFCSRDALTLIELVELIERETRRKLHLSSIAGTKADSPFGVPRDWTMRTHRAESLGITPSPTRAWLPDLVREIIRSWAKT